MSNRVIIHAAIKSPSGTVTVGPDRKLRVTIEAWCKVAKKGGGNTGGGKSGGGIIQGGDKHDPFPTPDPGDLHSPQPLGGGLDDPDKNMSILSTKKLDAGKVEVDLGNGFREAIKHRSSHFPNKWHYTGKVTPGRLEIKAKVYPGKGFTEPDFSGGPKTVSRRVEVKVEEDHDEPKKKKDRKGPKVTKATLEKVSLGPPYMATISGKAEDESNIKSVKWHLGSESGLANNKSGDWTSWEAEVPLPNRTKEHTIRISAEDKHGNKKKKAAEITIPADNEPPVLKRVKPNPKDDPHSPLFVEGGVTVVVTGTTQSVKSKIKTVKWCKDGGPEKEAENINGDWSEWRFEAKFQSAVSHKIAIWVRDMAGNGGTKEEPDDTLEVHLKILDANEDDDTQKS